ncbi:expansin-like protein [uncultured Fibrobacter sp.]|uniref:expansin-like protein n=1 Tax=uncultured Fibrobacter sp. TaxID=261512 RepID=UPI0025D3E9BE|nr:expansin-like protein [uncultured Fibrobacter sp.]
MNYKLRSSWLLAVVLAGSIAVPFAFVACGDSTDGSPVAVGGDLSSSEMLAESSSSQESAKPLSSSAKISACSSSVKSESSSSGTLVESSSSEKVAESSSDRASSSSSEKPAESSDSGVCTNCDSYTAADPVLVENGGKGSVTTYGSITEKETSLGGACNYGQTNIQYYAAIHVNVSPGDDKGPWDGGMACGGCVHVKAKTPDGWKEVTVRITDRCPDADCGVDLGGAPASDIMGIQVGRYYGEWEFVSCEGVEGVWGDSTSIWVKEGASTYWSIIQVRNPKDAVRKIVFNEVDGDKTYPLEFVVGTENFWTVPKEILQSEKSYSVVVTYRSGTDDEWILKGSDLAVPEANLYLYEHRKK